MARLEPPVSDASEAFWEATKEERFLVQWCAACEAAIFYPREVCPRCLSAEALEWRPSSGEGTVYAFSVQHRPANPTMAERVPYTVALVELDAGAGQTIRLMSNVTGDPDQVTVGMPVSLTWEPLSDGRNLPQFAPAPIQ